MGFACTKQLWPMPNYSQGKEGCHNNQRSCQARGMLGSQSSQDRVLLALVLIATYVHENRPFTMTSSFPPAQTVAISIEPITATTGKH